MSVRFNASGDTLSAATSEGTDYIPYWQEIWFKLMNAPSADAIILGFADPGTEEFDLYLDSSGALNVYGGPPLGTVSTGFSPTLGTWYRYAFGLDYPTPGTTQKVMARVMLSGSNTIVASYTSGAYAQVFARVANLRVGSDAAGTTWIDGEFRAWLAYRNQLLSDANFQSNRISEDAVFTTGLWGQWRLQTTGGDANGINSSAGTGGVNATTANLTNGTTDPADLSALPGFNPAVQTIRRGRLVGF